MYCICTYVHTNIKFQYTCTYIAAHSNEYGHNADVKICKSDSILSNTLTEAVTWLGVIKPSSNTTGGVGCSVFTILCKKNHTQQYTNVSTCYFQLNTMCCMLYSINSSYFLKQC